MKIKNRFAALARCLDLDGPPPQFELAPQAVPVVVLCQNFEFPTIVVSSEAVAGNLNVESAPLTAGLYDVSWVFSTKFATAFENVSSILIGSGSAPITTRLTLFSIMHGLAGQQVQSGSFRLNVIEGERIRVEAEATGASNKTNLFVVLQPN